MSSRPSCSSSRAGSLTGWTASSTAAWAKDTVVVGSGTYHEHDIVMKSGVLLRSETLDPASVVIDIQQLD